MSVKYKDAFQLQDAIRTYCVFSGKTQTQLSKELGHNEAYLHQFMQHSSISSQRATKICTYLVETWPEGVSLPQVLREFISENESDGQDFRKTRECMTCGHDFLSEGIGNRMCQLCRTGVRLDNQMLNLDL